MNELQNKQPTANGAGASRVIALPTSAKTPIPKQRHGGRHLSGVTSIGQAVKRRQLNALREELRTWSTSDLYALAAALQEHGRA